MYLIRIESDKSNYSKINTILGLIPTSIINDWEYEIPKNKTPILEIHSILFKKILELNQIGIENDNVAVWLYYEYENQCNMEFSGEDLKLLSSLNISFCISCWEK